MSTHFLPFDAVRACSIADDRKVGDHAPMTPGSAFNWFLAAIMLAFALVVGLIGRITLRGGEVLDRDVGPIRFWAFVIGCGVVAVALFAQAIFHFR